MTSQPTTLHQRRYPRLTGAWATCPGQRIADNTGRDDERQAPEAANKQPPPPDESDAGGEPRQDQQVTPAAGTPAHDSERGLPGRCAHAREWSPACCEQTST